MSVDLDIRVDVDNSGAAAGARATTAEMRRVEDAARHLARVQEDATRAAARAQEDAARRAAGGTIDEAQRAARIQEDLARRVARVQEDETRRVSRVREDIGDRAAEAPGNVLSNLTGIGSALQAFNVVAGAAKAGFGLIVDGFNAITQAAEDSARATLAYRESQRLVSTLQGFEGPNNQAIRQGLQERVGIAATPTRRAQAGTLLSGQEQERFTAQFEGSLPVGLEKGNITRDIADQFRAAAALRAARQGGDTGIAGDLAGIIAQFGKVESAQQGLGIVEGVRRGLSAGRGDDPQLTKQLLQVAGATVREGGGIKDIQSLSTLVGVASLSAGPEAAGTRVEQLLRSLRLGLGKARKGARATDLRVREFFKQVGIQENEAPEKILERLAPILKQQQEMGRDLDVFLKEVGFIDAEGRRAIVETYSNLEAYKKRLKGQGDSLVMGAEEIKRNAAFLKTASGQARLAESEQEIATLARGAQPGREMFLALTARTAARSQEADEDIPTQIGDKFRGALVGGGADEGKKIRNKGDTLRLLETEIRKYGLEAEYRKGRKNVSSLDEAGAQAAEFIKSRGGDTTAIFDQYGKTIQDQAANIGALVPQGPALPSAGILDQFGPIAGRGAGLISRAIPAVLTGGIAGPGLTALVGRLAGGGEGSSIIGSLLSLVADPLKSVTEYLPQISASLDQLNDGEGEGGGVSGIIERFLSFVSNPLSAVTEYLPKISASLNKLNEGSGAGGGPAGIGQQVGPRKAGAPGGVPVAGR